MHYHAKPIAVMVSLMITLSAIPLSISPVSAAFSDIGQHRYREAIEYIRQQGVVEGYADGGFHPDALINRAEMLKMILVAQLKDESAVGTRSACFSDVKDEWFARFVCYAKEKNIVKGYPGDRFSPNQSVNMVEAEKMALETFAVKLPALQQGEEWYEPYREFSHSNNIFSKFNYLPGKFATRGEVAQLIAALMRNDDQSRPFTGIRQNFSAGCGKSPPSPAPTGSVIGDVKRTYITDVPKDYDADEPIALTFGWHGRTNLNSEVRGYYRVYQASAGESIMVYPAGLPGGWKVDRDVQVFDQLLQEFADNYCIDLDRVYVVGHSLGAWFTNSLSCVRGDVIRASGSLGGGTTINKNCTGPVAAIILQNPADTLSPLAAGITARDQLLRQNGCGTATEDYQSPEQAHCVRYSQCAPDAPVVWCPHTEDYSWGDYYPHGWPRWTGGEIWSFFASLNGN